MAALRAQIEELTREREAAMACPSLMCPFEKRAEQAEAKLARVVEALESMEPGHEVIIRALAAARRLGGEPSERGRARAARRAPAWPSARWRSSSGCGDRPRAGALEDHWGMRSPPDGRVRGRSQRYPRRRTSRTLRDPLLTGDHVTRQATLEEALRLIRHNAWCKLHSSPRRVAEDAFAGELLLEVTDGGVGFHVCADCEEVSRGTS